MRSIGQLIRENMVLFLAGTAALASMIVVPPTAAYAGYINMPVLSVLFCLMVVIGGLRESGVFAAVLARLLLRLGTMRQLAAVLIFSCFFVSMWVTNDVSLLTFVPFSLMALPRISSERQIALVIVLQTLAANLGSMCTPVGNPQNLYLYFYYGMDLGTFLSLLLPYTLVSLALLALSVFLLPGTPIPVSARLAARRTRESARTGAATAALAPGRDVFPFPAHRGPRTRLPTYPGHRRRRHGPDPATVFPLRRLPPPGHLCRFFRAHRQYEPADGFPGDTDGISGRS